MLSWVTLHIDWPLLRRQKLWLLAQPAGPEADGLLTLIDSLQDFAVDHAGVSEVLVFGPQEEEEEEALEPPIKHRENAQ